MNNIKNIMSMCNQSKMTDTTDTDIAYTIPLTVPTHMFVGKKPVAVVFRDKDEEESIDVKTWREVYAVILKKCSENPYYHKALMSLRNKVSGKCRIFLSDKPDGMTRPLKIDEDMFVESHYGSSTMMGILINHLLTPIGFDNNGIRLILKAKGA